jgi:hypothetical protein
LFRQGIFGTFALSYPLIHGAMKHTILILSLVFAVFASIAQDQRHVVFLKNKDNNPYSLSNPSAFLTQRALERRSRQGIVVDMKDLPVTPSYIAQIAATGAQVIFPMRWFNAVMIATSDPTVLAAISALPFVDHLGQVAPFRPAPGGKQGIKGDDGIPPYRINPVPGGTAGKSTGTINYGQAYNQAHMIAADGLHDLGFTGNGMMIAVLDAGFYHVDQLSAFDSLFLTGRILGTRDFHLPGNNVYGDDMHTHGTSVLSTMGANLPGEIVGTAPHASYWLIRTEVGDYEALEEEYNWAAGAEFADSIGADIINSSLGYTTFDNPMYDHTYADMNGNITPVTRAADLACSRGILVVNSAGNSGGSAWQYIGAPADGDSVFSIGAVDESGAYAGFSSTGPTSDGRIKPDVSAQGQGTTIVSGWGWVGQGSGTSFSSPVTAGALACLWQSVPDLPAEQIRNAVRSTASKASNPDNLLGYGIPNMVNARLSLSSAPGLAAEREYTLSPVPFTDYPVLRAITAPRGGRAELSVFTAGGHLVFAETISLVSGAPVALTRFSTLASGIYFVRISGESGAVMLRAVKIAL